MGLRLTGVCPACGAGGQGCGPWQALTRRVVMRCTKCAKAIESELSLAAYLFICLLSTTWGVLLFGVSVVALLTGAWLLAGGAALLLWAPVFLPAQLLHSGRLKIYNPYAW